MNTNHVRKSNLDPTLDNLSKAIFIVNRHAKTASNPKFLYELKRKTLHKLIENGEATKLGLHFSRTARLSQQRSDVVIQCGDYQFHMPPEKSDFTELPHLGKLDDSVRNPKTYMSLSQAKALLMDYTGVNEPNETLQQAKKSPFISNTYGSRPQPNYYSSQKKR